MVPVDVAAAAVFAHRIAERDHGAAQNALSVADEAWVRIRHGGFTAAGWLSASTLPEPVVASLWPPPTATLTVAAIEGVIARSRDELTALWRSSAST